MFGCLPPPPSENVFFLSSLQLALSNQSEESQSGNRLQLQTTGCYDTNKTIHSREPMNFIKLILRQKIQDL